VIGLPRLIPIFRLVPVFELKILIFQEWVIASLKPEFRHIYQKRGFYIDEDSWQVQVADMYDSRNELYRVGIAHGLS
jgi:hypothetical protein